MERHGLLVVKSTSQVVRRSHNADYLDGLLVDAVLRRWATLAADDPRNRPLTAQDPLVGLSGAALRRLRAAGIVDLRGLAKAILGASQIAEQNARRAELNARLSSKDRCVIDLAPLPAPVSPAQATALRDGIAARLMASEGPVRRRKQ